jgi:hypothetical protein
MKLFLGFLKMSYVFKHGDSSINYFWDRAHNIFKAKLNKMMKDLIHNNKSDIKTLLFIKDSWWKYGLYKILESLPMIIDQGEGWSP